MDLAIGVPGWDKLMDLLVEAEAGRKFACWVFDRQQRSRQDLLVYRRLPGVQVHFIHTQSTLVRHSPTQIALTASQRDFTSSSKYDGYTGFGGYGHLHFLEGEDSKLRIYRGLRCEHEPNLFGWEALREGSLSAARISPKTGEMVLAEDVAARTKWNQKLKEEKEARRAAPPHPPEDRRTAMEATLPAEPGRGALSVAVPAARSPGPETRSPCWTVIKALALTWRSRGARDKSQTPARFDRGRRSFQPARRW